jgi:hypothetical protein
MKFAPNKFLKLFVLVFMFALGGTSMSFQSPLSQIDIAIKKLWSPNETERADGVNELLRIGHASIEKLTSLLGELIHDQRPRFAPSREQEGESALQEYLRCARTFYSGGGGDYAETRAAKDLLTALTINSTLMIQIVQLLGKLKAQQSIPLLMEMVNRHWEDSHLGPEINTPETVALERIGAESVPRLAENLNEATIRAYGFEPLVYGWRVVVEEDDEPDPEEELDHQIHIGYVRLRVAAVLGDIGDTRALPYLEKLLREIKSSPESPVFGTAGSLSGTIGSAVARINQTGAWSPERKSTTQGRVRVVPIRGKDFGRPPSSEET